jgi:hypothetical protein
VFLGLKLQEFYLLYKKTNSHNYLRAKIKDNDKINEKLFLMEMMAIDL